MIVVTVNGNQLVLDPKHQKKARQLSSFLKGVPTKMVNQCGHTSSLIVIVYRTNLDCSTLDFLYLIYLLLDVWVPDSTVIL